MKRGTLAAQRTTVRKDAAAEHVGLLQSTLSQQSMPPLAPTHLDLMKATCDLSDGAAAEHASLPVGCAVARASTS